MDIWDKFKTKDDSSLNDILSDWELFWKNMWPEDLEALSKTPQSPKYHAEGDVLTHTKMVVGELLRHNRFKTGTEQEQKALLTAAMLHDVAKSWTTQEIQEEIRAPMHSKKGAIEIRKRLWLLTTDPFLREQICALVLYHQAPFFALSHDSATAEFLARKMSCDVDLSLLCALAECDMRGRICEDQQKVLDDIELFEQLAKDLSCFDREYLWPDKLTRSEYVRGHGKIHADTPVHKKDFEVFLLSGLPASGKDTWCAEKNLPVVSYDDIRQKHKYKHGSHTGEIVHEAHDLAREYLRKKESFIWNATHLSADMRAPASKLIRQYQGSVHHVCFETNFEDVMTRNNLRNTGIKNAKIVAMAGKWEMPLAWEAENTSFVWGSQKQKLAIKRP